MTKTVLLGASAAVFAVAAMLLIPNAVADTQNPLTFTKDPKITKYTFKGEEFMKVKFTVDVKHIQKFIFQTDKAFGYGILTDGGNNVVVIATHVCASDSPYQGNAWKKRCPNPVGLEAFSDKFVKRHDGQRFHRFPYIMTLTRV